MRPNQVFTPQRDAIGQQKKMGLPEWAILVPKPTVEAGSLKKRGAVYRRARATPTTRLHQHPWRQPSKSSRAAWAPKRSSPSTTPRSPWRGARAERQRAVFEAAAASRHATSRRSRSNARRSGRPARRRGKLGTRPKRKGAPRGSRRSGDVRGAVWRLPRSAAAVGRSAPARRDAVAPPQVPLRFGVRYADASLAIEYRDKATGQVELLEIPMTKVRNPREAQTPRGLFASSRAGRGPAAGCRADRPRRAVPRPRRGVPRG